MIIATLAMAQDDFFQPGYTIGGYGELHYNRTQNGNDDATIKLDFHRFIIYTAITGPKSGPLNQK